MVAFLIPALIGAAGAIGSSLLGKSAADKQASIAKKTLKKQTAMTAPYREAGARATGELGYLTGGGTPEEQAAALNRFRGSGEYQLLYENMLREARPEIFGQQAGAGNFFSGNTLKALQDRAARISDQLFGNYSNNLFKLAGSGLTATGIGTQNLGAASEAKQQATANEFGAIASGIKGVTSSLGSLNYPNMFASGGASSYAPGVGPGGMGYSYFGGPR